MESDYSDGCERRKYVSWTLLQLLPLSFRYGIITQDKNYPTSPWKLSFYVPMVKVIWMHCRCICYVRTVDAFVNERSVCFLMTSSFLIPYYWKTSSIYLNYLLESFYKCSQTFSNSFDWRFLSIHTIRKSVLHYIWIKYILFIFSDAYTNNSERHSRVLNTYEIPFIVLCKVLK